MLSRMSWGEVEDASDLGQNEKSLFEKSFISKYTIIDSKEKCFFTCRLMKINFEIWFGFQYSSL